MSKEMKIELMSCEEIILEEIANKEATRDNVALTYAFCIDSSEKIDFAKINKAIVDRWSRSALQYIKKEAWKLKGVGSRRLKE